uniref:Uncharacterized protein MANES_16G027700 n=1 Tax=Rhizophora mucronata TaxID=61149 RepID=A0A2P2IKH1_RHIMU
MFEAPLKGVHKTVNLENVMPYFSDGVMVPLWCHNVAYCCI